MMSETSHILQMLKRKACLRSRQRNNDATVWTIAGFGRTSMSTVKSIPLYEETSAKEITLTRFHSFFNGEAIYIVACLVLAFGIILVALLKIRTCRKSSPTRNPSLVQISEDLMVH